MEIDEAADEPLRMLNGGNDAFGVYPRAGGRFIYIKFDDDWSNDSSLMVVVCRLIAGVIEEAVDEGLGAPMGGVVDGNPYIHILHEKRIRMIC